MGCFGQFLVDVVSSSTPNVVDVVSQRLIPVNSCNVKVNYQNAQPYLLNMTSPGHGTCDSKTAFFPLKQKNETIFAVPTNAQT